MITLDVILDLNPLTRNSENGIYINCENEATSDPN